MQTINTDRLSVSVVIPTYNHAQYVREAVASVLAQTHRVNQIIVVDDGSTDNTRQILAEFEGRITYIFQKNRGLSGARNRGISEASGAWIAFLDADDWWLPDKIRLQIEAVRQNPDVAFVYTAGWASDGQTRDLIPAPDPRRLWPALRYLNCVSGSGSAAMIRRDVLEAEGGFDENLTACEDWDMWVRISRKYPVASVKQPVAVIRRSTTSMSTDYGRMIRNTEKILDKTLVSDLRGWRRSIWRRKIWGAQLFGASITARCVGPWEERRLLLRCLAEWPSPFFLPARWIALGMNIFGLSAAYRRKSAAGADNAGILAEERKA